MKRHLLVIVGPTGSGKTRLAELVASALPCRLLSADSQQVYRGMDIGTAKPLGEAKRAWGLLDLVDPGQTFSAGDWVRAAVPAVEAAWAEGKLPLLAGGTGLYLKALLEGLADIPAVPDPVRRALALELEKEGLPALVKRLEAVDPVLADRSGWAWTRARSGWTAIWPSVATNCWPTAGPRKWAAWRRALAMRRWRRAPLLVTPKCWIS
jgi:tRNA dimethylallyltransferase